MLQTGRLPLLRKDWVLLGIAWLFMQIFFLYTLGIEVEDEAAKYIGLSRDLVNGTVRFQLHDCWYAGYTGIHVLIRVLGLPPQAMYGVQFILSFISLVYFMKIIAVYAGDRLRILVAGILYATCFIIQQWTCYLFTDTMFYQLLIIGIYFMLQQNESSKHQKIFWSFLLFLPFFRPVGFLFIVVACTHWIFTGGKKNLLKLSVAGIYLVFLVFLVQRSILGDNGYFYPYHNLDANIICGLNSDLLKYQQVPYNRQTKIIDHFLHNPELAVRLFLLRFFKAFSLTRPFFSSMHNLLAGAACVFYYGLALMGLVHIFRKKIKTLYFLPVACIVFVIPSVAYCVEWSGRMSLPMFCCAMIMAGIGTSVLLQRFFPKN